MGNPRAIMILGLALTLVFLIPTGGIMILRIFEAEPVQLDLTLTLKSTSNNQQYKAAYRWTGDGIDTEGGSASITWDSRSASATVSSTGQLSQAIQSYFSSVCISFDYMDIRDTGEWSLDLSKQLCSGIYLGVDITGDESDINDISPYLQISFIPYSLSNAMSTSGVDEAQVDVRISFRIKGDILKEASLSFGILIDFYRGLLEDFTETTVGTISALAG